MFDYNNLHALCDEVDKLQAAGQLPKGKAYSLMYAFSDYLSTVKPTGYVIDYNPVCLYQVVYCENGERQHAKGWAHGFTRYSQAAVVQWALEEAYNAGRHSMGGDDIVF